MPAPLADTLTHADALGVHFQPIVSLKQKAVLGLEALARPKGLTVGELFAQAEAQGRLLELDRLCRRKALEAYRDLTPPQGCRPLLFLNFAAPVIDQGVVGSGVLVAAVREARVDPSDVVIEVNEGQVRDTAALRRFVDQHRALGFLIALDDLGAGDSNLPRIAELRPHIIKLDRSLVSGITRDYFRQETMKSLVSLGRRIGCMVLAEGVETPGEVDLCGALGAELFQGYHFARPQPPQTLGLDSVQAGLHADARRLRDNAVKQLQQRRLEGDRIRRLVGRGSELLAVSDPTGFGTVLQRLVRSDLRIECAYLLDKDGIQVSDTVAGLGMSDRRNRLFAPAPKGSDHSAKEYFYSLLDAGLERYTTEPYLSLATGSLCRTASVAVAHAAGKFVLCMDLKVES